MSFESSRVCGGANTMRTRNDNGFQEDWSIGGATNILGMQIKLVSGRTRGIIFSINILGKELKMAFNRFGNVANTIHGAPSFFSYEIECNFDYLCI